MWWSWHWCTRPRVWRRAMRKRFGEPKVSKYDVAIGSDKNILWLEVTIDNACSVQALDTLNGFGSIEAGMITPKAASVCQLCHKITARMEVLLRYKSAWHSWDYYEYLHARLTMTKNKISLSWKLHQSLTTNGSDPSAAMWHNTTCSVSVCWSSWCTSTCCLMIALRAYKSVLLLWQIRRTLPTHPLLSMCIISKWDTCTLRETWSLAHLNFKPFFALMTVMQGIEWGVIFSHRGWGRWCLCASATDTTDVNRGVEGVHMGEAPCSSGSANCEHGMQERYSVATRVDSGGSAA